MAVNKPVKLTPADFTALCEMLYPLPEFENSKSRKRILYLSSLDEMIPRYDLSGAVIDFVPGFIKFLEVHGYLERKDGSYYALRLLLEQLMKDTGNPTRANIGKIIKRYNW